MPVVRVIVMDKQDRVLLIQTRHTKSDGFYWIVPGGRIEEGEFSRDAAIREVKEETGLDITIKKLVWVEESKNERGQIGYIHYFLAERTDEEPIIGHDPELQASEQKIMDVAFKDREEIMTMEKVYPEVIKHSDFWDVVTEESHNPYVNRPSEGFGLE
ncbi:NUDIX hydrolase [Paenibacillus rhizovicinus]|uniref:NUDIX hydrolase n=1 Tax=Paenibacillus rhizovicinus TaxID=2704463 RepID=A0A6C0P690_9BACL|nr:NUDIX hydrolase [Paenibacillus rhizovicinus]QHW34027.1 NUDIX hydrolase [Paenibacillus rhizovicinus]